MALHQVVEGSQQGLGELGRDVDSRRMSRVKLNDDTLLKLVTPRYPPIQVVIVHRDFCSVYQPWNKILIVPV